MAASCSCHSAEINQTAIFESSANHSDSSHESTIVLLSSTDLENPLTHHNSDTMHVAGRKSQRVCWYELCPSRLNSKKWRIVTRSTRAGGRDWGPIVGQTLCDSCYSTYHQYGSFVRSVRTRKSVDSSVAHVPTNSTGTTTTVFNEKFFRSRK